MIRLQRESIRTEALIEAVRSVDAGATALFVGTVRASHRGRRVEYLEYHAYPEMAVSELERLAARAREAYDLTELAIVHRTGRLELGEASVAVAVSAPHRAAAQDACRFIIDTLKRTVPIWKKEFFEGGQVWIEGAGETAGQG